MSKMASLTWLRHRCWQPPGELYLLPMWPLSPPLHVASSFSGLHGDCFQESKIGSSQTQMGWDRIGAMLATVATLYRPSSYKARNKLHSLNTVECHTWMGGLLVVVLGDQLPCLFLPKSQVSRSYRASNRAHILRNKSFWQKNKKSCCPGQNFVWVKKDVGRCQHQIWKMTHDLRCSGLFDLDICESEKGLIMFCLIFSINYLRLMLLMIIYSSICTLWREE